MEIGSIPQIEVVRESDEIFEYSYQIQTQTLSSTQHAEVQDKGYEEAGVRVTEYSYPRQSNYRGLIPKNFICAVMTLLVVPRPRPFSINGEQSHSQNI
jgi:hypothetical protein